MYPASCYEEKTYKDVQGKTQTSKEPYNDLYFDVKQRRGWSVFKYKWYEELFHFPLTLEAGSYTQEKVTISVFYAKFAAKVDRDFTVKVYSIPGYDITDK